VGCWRHVSRRCRDRAFAGPTPSGNKLSSRVRTLRPAIAWYRSGRAWRIRSRSGPRPFQFLCVSALGPRTARSDHTLAIRRKCDCKAGLSTLPTNCIQSAARRMHSNSYFRQLTDSDTVHLLKTRAPNRCTALRVLSVACATEKSRENPKFRHIQSRCLGSLRGSLFISAPTR
jgi:hypothetical protein